ncbi:major facilitator superfamily domain-containing protein [Fennellomyces sp. T-0311]|nr:major facilitator superfamily domain-containing protein [Fennellomyces sp. T-0311]
MYNQSISNRPSTTNEALPENAYLSRTSTNTTQHDEEDFYDAVEPTPLPKLQMFIICTILISEPLTSTILLPFIYFMLKDFHLSDDEKEIGTYAGWITSIFFLAQFCTALLWGKYSDRHGRRPVLLTGLIGNSISACSFGLSKSLWWAVGTRAFCGILNGNGGVARSMVAEITDETNRAKAFSLFGFCWGIGMIGNNCFQLGGYLCNPVEHFPWLFGGNAFLKEFPYFLPCFVSSLGSLVGFCLGYFYLEESNAAVIARKRREADGERQALLHSTGSDDTTYTAAEEAEGLKHEQPKISSITKTTYVTILAYAIFAFHAMVFDEVLPLYFSAPRYAGGLGTDSQELAKALSIAGIQQLYCQFVLYPKINKYMPTLPMARLALFLFFPVYVAFPELSTLQSWLNAGTAVSSTTAQLWLFRLAYMSLLFVRYFASCLAFTSMMILVNNSADSLILGTVNGVLQSCLALVRALGKCCNSFLCRKRHAVSTFKRLLT